MKQGLLFFCIFFLILVILPITAADMETPTAMVTDFTVNPPVLESGGMGTIQISISQIGASQRSNQTDYQGDDDPFTNSTSMDFDSTVYIERVSLEGNGLEVLSPVFRNIGRIGSDPIPLTFVIRAPVRGGIYFPEVWMTTNAGSSRFPIPVRIDTAIGMQKQALIILSSAYPETVTPGDDIPVILTFRNAGMTGADEVSMTLGEGSTGIAPATTGKYYIGRINPDEQKTLNITFISDKNAVPGLIHIPVTLHYTEFDGTAGTEDASIDVFITGQADLSFILADTNLIRVPENQPFELPMRIRNTGSGPAKQVYVSLDLPLRGTKRLSVGKIAPGSDAPVIFLIDRVAEGSYVYNATITYADDLGTHTEVRQMTLRVTPDGSFWPKIVGTSIVILCIVGIVLVYRYRIFPRNPGEGIFAWMEKK